MTHSKEEMNMFIQLALNAEDILEKYDLVEKFAVFKTDMANMPYAKLLRKYTTDRSFKSAVDLTRGYYTIENEKEGSFDTVFRDCNGEEKCRKHVNDFYFGSYKEFLKDFKKYFAIYELVGKDVYHSVSDKDSLFYLLDPTLLISLYELRVKIVPAKYGPDVSFIINSYHWGGDRINSGLRDNNSTEGSSTSSHRTGEAADILIYHKQPRARIPASEVVKLMTTHIDSGKPSRYIKGIEENVTWNHIDTKTRSSFKENDVVLFDKDGVTRQLEYKYIKK